MATTNAQGLPDSNQFKRDKNIHADKPSLVFPKMSSSKKKKTSKMMIGNNSSKNEMKDEQDGIQWMTREEEGYLKTALALVVVKRRLESKVELQKDANHKNTTQQDSNSNNNNNSKNDETPASIFVDRLFSQETNINTSNSNSNINKNSAVSASQQTHLLSSNAASKHIHSMMQVAVTMASSALKSSTTSTNNDDWLASINFPPAWDGLISHLTHQLDLYLLLLGSDDVDNSNCSDESLHESIQNVVSEVQSWIMDSIIVASDHAGVTDNADQQQQQPQQADSSVIVVHMAMLRSYHAATIMATTGTAPNTATAAVATITAGLPSVTQDSSSSRSSNNNNNVNNNTSLWSQLSDMHNTHAIVADSQNMFSAAQDDFADNNDEDALLPYIHFCVVTELIHSIYHGKIQADNNDAIVACLEWLEIIVQQVSPSLQHSLAHRLGNLIVPVTNVSEFVGQHIRSTDVGAKMLMRLSLYRLLPVSS